ncbi:MAG: ECF transporter S component [Enterococcaceae bacterium]|jgi:uncharacterized membrane protein|nr:ECF transporter S component [Enterococcaceae bacterium]MCI1918532.1 ECF transporter S component [Enterococcaceae bacterium]
MKTKKNTTTFDITLIALFVAIMILLATTPLGFIPIGPLNATTMHIPVIIASLVMGPKIGGILGGLFGVISLIRATVIVTPLSFVFSPFVSPTGQGAGDWKALIVSIIPRILIGIVPFYVYRWSKKLFKKSNNTLIPLAIAGFLGSMTNTLLVMNLIYFLFMDTAAKVYNVPTNAFYGLIITIIGTQGIPEALIAAVLCVGITTALFKLMKRNHHPIKS